MSWSGRRAQALRAATLATYGTLCHLCGRPGANTADHLIPHSQGGPDSLENLRPAHKSCNSARGDMPLAQWRASRRYQAATVAPSREW
ncbi:HNH endonuclease [Nocardia amikacinitolerans]|uniref:HNH endonuclease n=1 Tax=Nocardia amikacinitolerans TaxID=756689 RepID=UPI0020A52343|nr:HNH endonuclease signature motif containing protein [Nocardia amikacinitolerans]MCP2281076.1 HNH endonuclease [Nocardia amikacinitolerans]